MGKWRNKKFILKNHTVLSNARCLSLPQPCPLTPNRAHCLISNCQHLYFSACRFSLASRDCFALLNVSDQELVTDGSWWVNYSNSFNLGWEGSGVCFAWAPKISPGRWQTPVANDGNLLHNTPFIGSFRFLFSLSQINFYLNPCVMAFFWEKSKPRCYS